MATCQAELKQCKAELESCRENLRQANDAETKYRQELEKCKSSLEYTSSQLEKGQTNREQSEREMNSLLEECEAYSEEVMRLQALNTGLEEALNDLKNKVPRDSLTASPGPVNDDETAIRACSSTADSEGLATTATAGEEN